MLDSFLLIVKETLWDIDIMRADNIKLAIIFSLLAGFFYAVLGVIIKLSERSISIEMIVFFRQFFGLMVLLPLVYKETHGFKRIKTEHLKLHLLRTFASIASLYCLVYSLEYLPLMDGLLLSYTRPLFIPIVVYIWFRKKWTAQTWIGLIVGFLGIALILKPDQKLFDFAAIMGISSAFFGAIAFTGIRRLTKTESTNMILFYFLVLSIPITAIPLIRGWSTPSLEGWGILLLNGVFGMIYQMMLTKAYEHAKSFKVASMLYSTIIFGALFDWWIGDFSMDLISGIGMFLILLGTFAAIKQKVAPFPPETTPTKK